jgi:putative tryptophan/tyrosine transport system substrate-binding protein
MMKRNTFVTGLTVGLFFGLITPIRLPAQTAGKVVRIGLLTPTDGAGPVDLLRLQTLRTDLRDLGWVDGKNLIIEVRHAGLNPQRQRELAAELNALPVALIVAGGGTITIRAARDAAPGLPVVMVNAGDPLGSGFVASLARPGGNLTGTSAAGEEILAKQVELLAAAVPHLKRISVLMNSANPANGFFFEAMSARAGKLGLRLDRIEVTAASELEAATARAKGGTLLVVGDPMFFQHRARILEQTLRAQIPSMFGGRPYVEGGGLMSYLSPGEWHWRKAATYIDKILKGAKPADLPVEQPTQFELVINLKTAKALGLTIPPNVLLRADEVIE